MSDSPDATPEPVPEAPLDGQAQAPASGPGAQAPEQAQAAAPKAQRTLPGGIDIRSALLAALCIGAGAVASIAGARAVAASDEQGQQRSFHRTAAAVTAGVKLGLAHEEDLLTSSGTYLSRNSGGTPREFRSWAGWAHVMHNHPELRSLGLIELVRQPELAAFAARLSGHPLKPAAPKTAAGAVAATAASSATTSRAASVRRTTVTGTTASGVTVAGTSTVAPAVPAKPALTIKGPGAANSFHCLTLGTVSRAGLHAPGPTFDYCGDDAALLATRDSAHSIYTQLPGAHSEELEVLAPAYRGSAIPASMVARRAAFVGWVREVLVPRELLAQALHGGSLDAARLRHHSGSSVSLFTLGTPLAGAQTTVASLQNGWSLRTAGPALSSAVFKDGDALAILVIGLALSLLGGALVLLPAVAPTGEPGTRKAAAQDPERHEELYDPLTGLPNRGLTLDRAERMLARAGRNSSIMIGALFIDIDWFKDINEKLGNEAGDQLLKIVAERLETVVRTHDTVGRHGGDEFVVLVESAVKGMRLDSLARRIIESLHKPVDLEGFGPSVHLTASIGVAFGRYATPDDLLRDAHMALFAAKAAGKDRYTLFNANMRAIIEGRGVLEVELNHALEEDQFSLLYQPVYDLQTHGVVGLEALLRWVHPKRGEVPPEDFIPIAEESGLIVPIGRWVLEQACSRAASWNVAGHRAGVAVKVAKQQLDRDGFVTDVLRALQQSGLEPSMLALEIAETTVMADKELAASRIEQLKQLGVRIAIDDFGGGYAYRADLQRMPIDFLKVDRSSLAASEDEDYRSWLLEAILVFGRDLSLTVIAKGVETQEQMLELQAMGCTMAQGFFLGQPTPSDSVERLFGVGAGLQVTDPRAGQPQVVPPLAPPAPAAQVVQAAPAAQAAPVTPRPRRRPPRRRHRSRRRRPPRRRLPWPRPGPSRPSRSRPPSRSRRTRPRRSPPSSSSRPA